MEWHKKFEVGHQKIDLEHRVFFDLVQSMAQANEEGASRDRLRRLIAELLRYAEFHFMSEENIMIDIGYPDLEEHHEHHKALIADLKEYILRFEGGDDNTEDLVKFLTRWFLGHTSSEDLLLAKYIKGEQPDDK